jgi:phospholipid-binding lipoprotein MlaA
VRARLHNRLARTAIAATLLTAALGCGTAYATPPGVEVDPWEPVNRKVFWFNDKLDRFLLEPVATGWDFVLPNRVQVAIGDFFNNARFPIYFVNSILQGKPDAAGANFVRFFVNTTLGFGGFLDVATNAGIAKYEEDFGQTLGVWGMNAGPYVVLPLLGPSSVRDATGQAVDAPMRIWPYYVTLWQSLAITSAQVVNWRSMQLDAIESFKAQALDYYAMVRSGYLQHREALVADAASEGIYVLTAEEEEDLYFFDIEEDY